MNKAFLLTRQWRDTPAGVCLDFWWASDNGPYWTQITAQEVVFFVRRSDAAVIDQCLSRIPHRAAEVALKNLHNQDVNALYFLSQRKCRDAQTALTNARIVFWEADIRPPERYLMERFITAAVTFDSNDLANDTTSLEPIRDHKNLPPPSTAPIINPRLQSADIYSWKPQLSALSIDIETSMDAKTLYSIAAFSSRASVVFMVGDSPENNTDEDTDLDIRYVKTVAQCLTEFYEFVQQEDPDVLLGWNVVQFDLWVLEQIGKQCNVPLALGRNRQTGHWRQEDGDGRRFVVFPGRVALDGIELVKAANYRFQNYSLANVSSELLGTTKLIVGDDRGAEITTLFRTDKPALARYNLRDCELVWDIFDSLKLLDFAIARSQLTGLLLDRIGGSVAAFEYLYLPRLHRKGFIAPNLGELESDIVSPGGYVMNSRPGLYDNVLVLDFKSLYPNIMRTFLIDPCAFWLAEHNNLPDDERVPGFNGASFAREGHVLPDVIAQLSSAREDAKCNNNSPLSHAIKIIMNSFYGVLGSTGCRFCDPRVSSSITLRGHEIIQKSREWIEAQGYGVIYGDTDSLFVWLENNCQHHPPKNQAQCKKIGERLARELNVWLSQTLLEKFQLKSSLEIQFETHYLRFLMPTIRGSELGTKKRYAGLVEHNGERRMVFKGLESVRTDWTPLAKKFQEILYQKIFDDEPYQEWMRQEVTDVWAARRDDDLIYRKRLRRSLHEYVKNVPPQVQAARKWVEMTGETLRAGDWISYVITVNGPEPLGRFEVDWNCVQSPIDYQHYIDKQIAPVADSILYFVGESLAQVTNDQLSLFDQD